MHIHLAIHNRRVRCIVSHGKVQHHGVIIASSADRYFCANASMRCSASA